MLRDISLMSAEEPYNIKDNTRYDTRLDQTVLSTNNMKLKTTQAISSVVTMGYILVTHFMFFDWITLYRLLSFTHCSFFVLSPWWLFSILSIILAKSGTYGCSSCSLLNTAAFASGCGVCCCGCPGLGACDAAAGELGFQGVPGEGIGIGRGEGAWNKKIIINNCLNSYTCKN